MTTKTAFCLSCTQRGGAKFAASTEQARPVARGSLTVTPGRGLNYRNSSPRTKRVASLRLLGSSGTTDAARVRRSAVVLLLLTLHAVLAGATHLPRLGRTPTKTQTDHALSSAASCNATGSTASTESGAHAQCILCRLQRSLSTGLGNSAPVAFSPPQDYLLIESASADTPRTTPPGVAPGRAPPRSRKA